MLPAQHRLRKPQDFSEILRKGKRRGNRYLVIHHLAGQWGTNPPLVGFIVPKKAIPHAVDRNRVKRQLRALISKDVFSLGLGSGTVIRVLPDAKSQSSEVLLNAYLQAVNKLVEVSKQTVRDE